MTFDPESLPGGGLGWMDGSGEESAVVVSSRVRLARNVEGYAFSGRSREGERLRVFSQIRDALATAPATQDGVLVRVDQLKPTDRLLLHERHVVSKELAALDVESEPRSGSAVFVGRDFSIMVNEEDHLRIQALRSGLDLERAFSDARDIDIEMGQRLPFAFHREFGFLTACPTNAGTGLRASVLVHLPALVLTKEIGRVLVGLQQVGLTYRGLYGEGSEVIGNLFQISNQTTLGRSEQDLLDYLQDIVRHVIEKEVEARKVLLRDAEYILEDKLWRAYGTLRYARSLSFEEAMNLLSGVRLAIGLKLIDGLSVYNLNELLVFTQLAHLAQREGRVLTEDEAGAVRATLVRETLERAAQ
jgi:protein arginine kinase